MEAKFVVCAEAGNNDCLLCPNKISKELRLHHKDIRSATSSLQVLFKYLDIDVRRIALTSGGGGHHESEGDGGLAMSLCEDCSSLANLFQEIHQDFETARLLLTGCVSKFMDRVKAASQLSGGADGHHLWMRAEILKQCDLHVQKAPKEELEKLLSDYSEPDRHSSFEELQEPRVVDQPVTGSIIPIIPNVPEQSTSSGMVQNGAAPSLEETGTDNGVKPAVVSQLDEEMDQILKTNHDLIRRLSDVVSRTKFARQSTSVSSTTSHIQEVVPPNQCMTCGVTSSNPHNLQLHMMLVHTTSFFSERFPPGTSEVEVAQVVSRLCEAEMSSVGKGRINCKLCGSVQSVRSLRCHCLQSHADVIISALKTLKSGKGSSSLPTTPRSNHILPPASSKSSATRWRIQSIGAKFRGGAKLKCRICGQWCLTKKGLEVHTALVHHTTTSNPTKITKAPPPSTIIALRKMTTPSSKPANSMSHQMDHSSPARNMKLHTCLYCSATFGTPRNCHRHMLMLHPLQYWAGRLPPSTTQKDWNTAIKIVEEGQIIAASARNKVDCRLCSRVCGVSSSTLHLLDKHSNAVLATVKSLVEEGK